MKNLLKCLFVLACLIIMPTVSFCQFTTVNAVVLDPNGAPYAGCQGNASFVPSPSATQVPTIGGSTFTQVVPISGCDSFATFTMILADNNFVVDGHTSPPASQWRFGIASQDGKTAFSCTLTITGATQDVSSQLQACAAPLPASAGGGGAFVVKATPCASNIVFTMAGVPPVTANTAFTVPLNCNVATTSVVGNPSIQVGAVAQFTLTQNAVGGFTFNWPTNFIDKPAIQGAALATTNASFYFDGTNWHAQTFPASGGGGGGGNPGGVAGDVQKNSGINTFIPSAINDNGSTVNIKEDTQFAGPTPWADIRDYGAYGTLSSTTGGTTSGQPTVVLASSQNFKNGEYVTVNNAGAPASLSAMGTVTLTPSIQSGGFNTVAAGVGALSFNYEVIAADQFGGYTAASVAVTTSTGNALGQQIIPISTFARSGQVVTVTTSSAHPFVVGSQVNIQYQGGNTDSTFWGFFVVKTVPDNLHFTYIQNLDTAGGATTSDSGGHAIAMLCNHLTWAPTGAWKYYVYGRTGGTYTLLSVTMEPYFDDYGSPMNDNRSFPSFIPTTAPSVGANDHLTAKILSGGGTTNLTLNTNAGASGTFTINSDDGPAIVAAGSGSSTVFVPGSAVINSYTTLPNAFGSNRKLLLAGTITNNDTVEVNEWDIETWGQAFPGSFAWEGVFGFSTRTAYPQLVVNAGPNIFRHLLIQCSANNGCLDVYEKPGSGAINTTFEYVQMTTGAGSAQDYLGLHGLFGFGGFSTRFNKVTFLTGTPGVNSTAGIGGSFMPSWLFKVSSGNSANAPSGNIDIEHAWFQGRSSFDQDFPANSGGGNYFIINDVQTQNMFLPIFIYSGANNSPAGFYNFQNITPADFPTALIGNLSTNDITMSGLYLVNGTAPNQSGIFVTGAPFSGFLFNVQASGINSNFAIPPSFPNEAVLTNNTGDMGYSLNAPGTPTVVVGGHGSCVSQCVAAGTYYYKFAPADTAARYSTTSAASSAATTDGTQTITVSWTPVPGQVTAYVGRGTSPISVVWQTAFLCETFSGGGYTDLSIYSYSASFPCSGSSGNALGGGISSGVNSLGVTTQQLSVSGGGFFNAFTGTFSANRTTTIPDNTGTLAELNLAQTWTAPQSFSNGTQLRFFSPNGTNFTSIQGPSSNGVNVNLVLPNANSSGVQCFNNDGSGNISYSNCSGGTGTPGGSNTQVQFNSSGSFGASPNLTWISPALTVGLNATATGQIKYAGLTSGTVTTQSQDAAGTWTFKWPATAGTAGFPMVTDGTGVASWAVLGLAGGGTGANAGAYTPSQLIYDNAGVLGSLTGTLTGTNPVLTLTSALATSVPFALNTSVSPTADVFDINLNSVKTSWVDNLGVWHAPSYTANGAGALALSGTESTCPTPAGGIDILCIGNLATHTIQSSLNGAAYKDNAQFSNSGPATHGVCLVGAIFPQLNCTTAGAVGQAFVSGGAGADGSFGVLGAVGGGTGNATNTLHGVGMGEGTAAMNFSSAGTAGQAFLSGGAGADGAYAAINLAGGSSIVTGVLPLANVNPNIVTVTGAITPNNCVKWSSATVVTDSGGTCGGAGGSARLDQLLAATVSNTINSTIFPQTWNWALTGSTTAMTFGENTAATGTLNIILRATTLATSTAKPFQADNNGNGVSMSSTGVLAKLGTGSISADALNGTAFSGTPGDLVSFGASNIPVDAGFLATNVVRKDAANSGTSAMTLDLSLSSASNAFRIPVKAGCTSGTEGSVCYDSTALITHIRTNSADSLAAATTSTSTTTTFPLFATAVAGVYNPRAIAVADLPSGATTDIANGTAAMGTSTITSGTCATVVTVSATGVATTDVITVGFNGDPTAVTGYGVSATGAVVTIYPYPTTNNVNFKVCNSTNASITPGALTLNWKVTR